VTVTLWFDAPWKAPMIGLLAPRGDAARFQGFDRAHHVAVPSGMRPVRPWPAPPTTSRPGPRRSPGTGGRDAGRHGHDAGAPRPGGVVKEPRATPAFDPAADRVRPAAAGRPGLAFAGDWTATGLPATLEGAVRSGRAAARHLLASGILDPST
jgi:hypothetical protein